MVPPRGDAPRSSGYLPGALLLSYGGDGSASRWLALRKTGGAPENRTLDAFAGAAVFGTVSSSVPDVLREGAAIGSIAQSASQRLAPLWKLAPQHGLAP